MVFLIFGNLFRNRLITIHFLQIQEAAYRYRKVFSITLVFIQIHPCPRSHYYIMPHVCRSNTAFFSSPTHYSSCWSKSTFKYLVPTDHLLIVFQQELFDALYKVALQFLFSRVSLIRLQAKFFYTSLTLRTYFPSVFRTLVSTNMEVFAFEQRNHFFYYIFQELEYRIVSGAIHIVCHTPETTYIDWLACTRQLGICSNCSYTMSGQFYFGYNFYKAFLSVCHNLFHLILCIEIRAIFVSFTLCSLCSYLCKLRVFLYFDAPTLIFCQVPVKCIDLEHRQHIQLLLYKVYINKVTANIEMHSSVLESRLIFYCYSGYFPCNIFHKRRTFYFGRKQLHYSLHRIKQPVWCFSLDIYPLFGNVEQVTFFVNRKICDNRQINIICCRFSFFYTQVVSCRCLDFCSKVSSYFFYICVVCYKHNTFSKLKSIFFLRQFEW